MSLAINPEKVIAVLLADGWHNVKAGTFEIDSYEFAVPEPDDDPHGEADIMHGGGDSGICAAGFIFTEVKTGSEFAGPLTSVLAVRIK